MSTEVLNAAPYTTNEVDTQSKLALTATKADAAGVTRNGGKVFTYKSFGASHFNEINLDLEAYISSSSDISGPAACGFTVSYQDYYFGWGTSDPSCYVSKGAGSAASFNMVRGYWDDYTTAYVGTEDTLYHCNLVRAAGSGTITLYVYSDAEHLTELGNGAVTGFGTGTRFENLFPFSNVHHGLTSEAFTGYFQNFDVNEASQVNSDMQAVYNVRALVESDMQAVWAVRKTIESAMQAVWNVATVLGRGWLFADRVMRRTFRSGRTKYL